MAKKEQQTKTHIKSIQSKITLMTIAFTVIAVVLFLLIVSFFFIELSCVDIEEFG